MRRWCSVARKFRQIDDTNVSALWEQFREAAETVAAFIVRHAGCDPE
jgi:hypothetical protein